MTAALRLDVAPALADASSEGAPYPPRVAPATWPQTEQSRQRLIVAAQLALTARVDDDRRLR